MSKSPTLILIPGLGANGRLFDPQRTLSCNVVVPDWLDPLPRETLAAYGKRLAERLEVRPPFFLGGVSMGGMLALEMSRWTRPEAVLLIATTRTQQGLRPVYRTLGTWIGLMPLWHRMPRPAVERIATLFVHYVLPSAKYMTPEQREILASIARECSPGLVRWGCRAVSAWPGMDGPDAPVHHVHGGNDAVFPVSRLRPLPDRIIPGGTHLINLTHADEVNAFLTEKIEKHLKG